MNTPASPFAGQPTPLDDFVVGFLGPVGAPLFDYVDDSDERACHWCGKHAKCLDGSCGRCLKNKASARNVRRRRRKEAR